jgi:multidrug resistance efflux pump
VLRDVPNDEPSNGGRYVTWVDFHRELQEWEQRQADIRHQRANEAQAQVLRRDELLEAKLNRREERFERMVKDAVGDAKHDLLTGQQGIVAQLALLSDPKSDHMTHHAEIKAWRAELAGAAKTVRVAGGTSVVAFVASAMAILLAIMQFIGSR